MHGIDPEEVHFHEVGAIDSIVDMIGAAICWELLDVDRIVCQNLEVGGAPFSVPTVAYPFPRPPPHVCSQANLTLLERRIRKLPRRLVPPFSSDAELSLAQGQEVSKSPLQ